MCKEFWLLPNRLFITGKIFVALICYLAFEPVGICAFPAGDCKQLIPENIRCYPQASSHARHRLTAFRRLIADNKTRSTDEKLQATNHFFNQFSYLKDERYEGVADYWKTPAEFIIDGAGDSEDFVMAKYFTLRSFNISRKMLRIAYVKSLELNQSHMVLTYYATPFSEPLILDNLREAVLPASKREDLRPAYSFDGERLWLARHHREYQTTSLNNF